MGALQRYILRSATGAFLAALFGITGMVWISQSLRDFDLITSKGQSLWTFLLVTLLGVPTFAIVVAPAALFGAIVYVLYRLNTDSELAAISAAGIRPRTLFQPFLILTIVVSLLCGFAAVSAAPSSLRIAREILTRIRADVIVSILREGEFTKLDDKITLHVRRREAGAALTGLLIEDNRDPDANIVYTAERGQVVKTDQGTYLVLEKGALQRKQRGEEDASIVVFDRYAFDLSPLTERELVFSYRPRELFIKELWNQAMTAGPQQRRLRAELHERFVNALYPLAFACIAFGALCRPKTTRQGRFTGIVIAAAAIVALRIAGMGLVNLTRTSDWAGLLVYLMPLAAGLGALAYGFGLHRWIARKFARTVPA